MMSKKCYYNEQEMLLRWAGNVITMDKRCYYDGQNTIPEQFIYGFSTFTVHLRHSHGTPGRVLTCRETESGSLATGDGCMNIDPDNLEARDINAARRHRNLTHCHVRKHCNVTHRSKWLSAVKLVQLLVRTRERRVRKVRYAYYTCRFYPCDLPYFGRQDATLRVIRNPGSTS